MSPSPYRSPDFRLWAFHVVANALPSAMIASHFRFHHPGDLLAMVAITLTFILAAPLTPLWPLYTRESPWGKALQTALWIRSTHSLVVALIMIRPQNFSFLAVVELTSGVLANNTLSELSRLTRGLFPAEGTVYTGTVALCTGLLLMGVVCILAAIIRCARWMGDGM